MQPSTKPREALEKARAAAQALGTATSLAQVEERWKDYLFCLERVWNKAEAHFSRSPKWQGWQGTYVKQRRLDPLLVYLTKARDTEEHSIEPITEITHGGVGIKPADPERGAYFHKIELTNSVLTVQADDPIVIDYILPSLRLLPVTIRGRTYPVPKQHLGAAVDPSNIAAVASSGLKYYGDFLDSADRFFGP